MSDVLAPQQANPAVQDKLNLSELAPASVIAQRRATFEAFWSGEDIGRAIMIPIPWENKPFTDAHGRSLAQSGVDRLHHRLLAGVDCLPFMSAAHGFGTVVLASAFGGKVITTSDGKTWIEPIIRKPQDAFDLQVPPPVSGLLADGLKVYHDACAMIDGYVPPQVPDMQGPLQTASFLWDQEQFILAMYDAPEAVHHSLKIVTEYIISVIDYFRRTYPDAEMMAYPSSHLPQSLGCMLTEDFCHLLSPALYEEFGLPYVNQVSDAFGGVFIHCCGQFKHHWPVFKKVHNLRGLDTMYPFSRPEEIYECFPDIVHSMGVDFAEVQRSFKDKGPDAWLEFVIAHTPRHIRWQFVTEGDNPQTVKRQLDIVRRTWATKAR